MTAAKRPAFQFYPADWRKDVELRACSVAARGLWIDLLCVAHECDPYGHLAINGKPMTVAQIAGQVGLAPPQCRKLLDELLSNGVARKTAEGTVFSKRMVDDERIRNARAEGGKAGGEYGIKGADAGKRGGRPKTEEGGSKTPLPEDGKPPPSSSSSSSTSASLPESIVVDSSQRARDDDKPRTWEGWRAWFETEQGVGCDPYSVQDRKKFMPLAQRWLAAGVTFAQMSAAVTKAHAESTEPIAYLPAYADRVLATISVPPKAAAPTKQAAIEQRNADTVRELMAAHNLGDDDEPA